MKTTILYQGVLNDDYVYARGKSCKLVYYTFANEWSNHANTKVFDDIEDAIEWYKTNFKDRAVEQGEQYLVEAGEYTSNNCNAEQCVAEWEDVSYLCWGQE